MDVLAVSLHLADQESFQLSTSEQTIEGLDHIVHDLAKTILDQNIRYQPL